MNNEDRSKRGRGIEGSEEQAASLWQAKIAKMVAFGLDAEPESAIVELVRILGSHPSNPGSSPGGGIRTNICALGTAL